MNYYLRIDSVLTPVGLDSWEGVETPAYNKTTGKYYVFLKFSDRPPVNVYFDSELDRHDWIDDMRGVKFQK